MRLTRRRFFVGPALGWMLSRVFPAHAGPIVGPTPLVPAATKDSTLPAYVDVLIPADETPSGTALGVDKRLLILAEVQPEYQRLLDQGLAWLNRQAYATYRRSFAELDEGAREAVVREAAAADYKTLPRVFFERTRADAFFHYYGRPEAWRTIKGYHGPPQPTGFMDYTHPPRTAR